MLGNFRKRATSPVRSPARRKQTRRGSQRGHGSLRTFESLEPRLVLDGAVLISEFLAINDSGLQDFQDDRPDWIEIHNSGSQAVDLTGWMLKDSNNEWGFPGMSLGPGEFRVIFASGKNLSDPAGELHTNFSLKGDGEYLGLLDAGGTVIHEYDEYPPQTADISYGIAQNIDTTQFVASGDSAAYRVPNGDPGAWTALTFDDGTWAAGETALGFADTVPGFAVWNYKANVEVGHLNTAVQVIENTGMQSYVNSENRNVINYFNSGGQGHYTVGEVDFPGFLGEMNDFVVEATGYVTIPSAGQWSFGVNSDDGFSFELDNGTHRFYMDYPDPRGTADTIATFDIPAAGTYSARLVYYERGGGAAVEVFAAQGAHAAFDADAFDLVGDTAHGGLEVFSEPVGGGSGGSTFTSLIETDVQDVMKDVNASLLVRIPFSVDDPAQLESLTLKMKYDDGYVVYLNGTEIARRNAPASPVWNSTATGERTETQAATWENVDVSQHLLLINADDGTPRPDNVLAIHALNYTADDGDFLILPELVQTRYLGLGEHFFATATPGNVNTEEYWLRVEDTRFSHDRGFYDESFSLTIATDTPGAEIYYTTDGSQPGETHGTLYTTPVVIRTTTVVRAVAVKAGYAPTDVDTQTYLFLDDVIRQPGDPAGFPVSWGRTSADYQMDPDVVDNPLYSEQLIDSLRSIPTLSIVTENDNLFGASGIYSNPGGEGIAWERPTSVEWIEPDGTTGFHVDAGLRIYGGAFRGMNLTRKKTFRLLFKSDYGPSKLEFPMFGDDGATTSFDTLILRAGANDAWNNWGTGNTQYIVDEFMRRTQLALGEPAPHGTFVHLYLNGLYWGLYNPVERPESSFSATYFGGEKEEWDALNSAEPVGESNTTTWNAMLNQIRAGVADMESYQRLQGSNPDGTNNPAYDDLLDVDNYIAYMFSNFWGGTGDWPHHNWYAACRRPPNASGFKSFNWDSEGAIVVWSNLDANTTGVDNSIAEPYAALRQNPEFRMRFADLVHKYMFNGGPGTVEASLARYQTLADEVELAIISESARWGDQASATPYTQTHWATTRDYVLNTYMLQRPAIVLSQMRSAGFYPNVDAPSFRVNGSHQHGGTFDLGDMLTIAAPAGTVYYTTDGSDPRPLGGGVPDPADQYAGGMPLASGVHVKSRVYHNGEWSALNEATFYVDLAPNLRITEIMYNPAQPTAAEQAAGYADNDAFEYIEIQNISDANTLPLAGLRFGNGIDFTFPDVSLGPGEYVMVVKDAAAFATRYDTFTGIVAGEYDGSLDNAGERIRLDAPVGGIIHDFKYEDGWYGHTDGDGFSLTIRNPQGAAELWSLKGGWRASAAPGGTPGYDDSLVTPGSVIISEVLAHSDLPYVDTIELHNVSDVPVDLSGWFLSDEKTDDLGQGALEKYQIPALPPIAPGGYLVLYEDAHFGAAFSLSELGDDVYLSSNAGGAAGGYREHVDFGASPTNVSIGLYTKSTGGTDFTLLAAPSFGSANGAAYLEDLVLNEVMYHPADATAEEIAAGFANDDGFEFIEIFNRSTTTAYPLTNYYVGNGVGFTFGWYPADGFGREAWTLEPAATATWTATLPAGLETYEVFARWDLLDAEGNQRDLDGQARYRVTHSGGASLVVRDQKPEDDDEGPGYMDPQGWVSLGSYAFDGSGQVVLTRGTDNPDNRTIADQVKFVSASHEVAVDNPVLDSWYTGNGPATIGPGEYLVIVRNYDAFDERYDVAGNGIVVAGAYTANLSNDGEKIKLMRVGAAEPTGYIPYYRIDYVNYNDAAPWPLEPDGQGAAMNRLDAFAYGNDPINWEASTLRGTPGQVNVPIDRTPPSVPDDVDARVTVNPDTITLMWDASTDGETHVDHYVVYRNGDVLAATADTFYDDGDVLPATTYSYQVSAVNRDGYESALSAGVVIMVPGIVSYAVPDETHVEIFFSEPLDPVTAEVLGNYVFTGGTLVDVALLSNGLKVLLTAAEAFVIGNPYSVTVNGVTTLSGNEMSDGQQIAFEYEPRGSGEILWQYWAGIPGTSIDALTGNPNYPDNPTGEDFLTLLEGPVDWAEEYGTRIRGYVHPPTTGEYTFWIAGDDNSQLYLSSDSNPDNAVLIASVPGWTGSRVWTQDPAQQSSSITLAAGQKYYIEVLHKEGNGGDNIAVRWLLPGDEWENPEDPGEPIPGIRLSPYVDDPRPIARDDSYEVGEGGALSVAAAGVLANDTDPLPGPLPLRAELVSGPAHAQSFGLGADGSFEYTPVPGYRGPDSFTYRAFDGMEYGEPATVRIAVVDLVRILSAEVPDSARVELLFSADLDETSAEATANYTVDGGLSVQSASLGADLRTVTLVFSPAMNDNQDYTLTVNNVRDASLAHVITANTHVVFQHTTWTGQDIGAVGAAGSDAEEDGVWTVAGSGADIWGTADAFHYVYQPFSGDGTITARVQSVENTDGWAKAGVMFRETLDAASVHAMTVVTPANGVSFQRRLVTGADSYHTTGAGPTAPYWVRAVREGDTLTSYTSPDGNDWTMVGTDTVAMSQPTIYVGLAVTSHSAGVVCTAVFDNVSLSRPDSEPPTADVVDVAPDPRATSVSQIDIVFSEPVTGLDLGDLSLTRDGGGNLLTGAASIATGNGIIWTLSGLSGLTPFEGTYTLRLTAPGSNIRDAAGNLLAADASDTWQMVIAGPTPEIVAVTPDPRNAPVGQIEIVFSEAVTGFDVGDLSLTRDGGGELLTGAETLTSGNGATWTLGGLQDLTGAGGTYTLALTAAGSGIENGAGEPLAFGTSETWTTDTTPPTADVVDVDPDPRDGAVEEIQIVFSEPVTGLDVGDLSLTRNGGENLLTGAESLTTSDYVTWTLGGLATLTGTGAAATGFVAFNDHVPGADTHANVTSYAANGTTSGLLKDIGTGANTGVTLTVTHQGVNFANAQSPPAAGTDAYAIFNGFVDFSSGDGASLEIEAAGNDHYTHTFAGLDTGVGVTYNFHGTAIRGNTDYANRWTLVTLVGVEAATPDHSSGIGVVTDGLEPNQVAIWTGYNSGAGQGFVAGWTAIDPGDDGQFAVVSTQYTGPTPGVGTGTASGGSKGYGLAGVRLEEVAATGEPGSYRLTLAAVGTGIQDAVANPLAAGATDAWIIGNPDLQPPTADVADVTPDPRDVPVDAVQIVFDKPVTGMDLNDLSLTRDGGADLLTGDEPLTTGDNLTFTLSGLSSLTAAPGTYTLTLSAAGSGIEDSVGNSLAADASDTFVIEGFGQVVARHVFYNNSAFDNHTPGADPADDDAIAPDPARASQPELGKTALLPGETATFQNYTSYARGVNGIMVDIAGLRGALGADDFTFRVGNDNSPGGWAVAPAPISVTVRAGAGQDGSDRVTLIWQDYAVQKQWLQVTVLANLRTGLPENDVFYFGNAVGESGNASVDAKVNPTDMLLARNNPRNFLNPAALDFNCDYNRDARVNATDMLIARNNQTHFLNALRLITVPGAKTGQGKVATVKLDDPLLSDACSQIAPTRLEWIYEFEAAGTSSRPREGADPAKQAVDALLATL
ncbi:MAG: lamin tail domain-containing protein [Pirellulales bacterium]|nr:lamin tail domain-containing protein [Pirellulales bacterium]